MDTNKPRNVDHAFITNGQENPDELITLLNDAAKQIRELEQENKQINEKIENAKNCLVAAAIGDPFEVIQITLDILE
ncbi:hypothetical protein GZ77_08940 [Endozoicomonas montiporae]|uniref:Uncharacterized protein n=2 Tax=Endozoicomonas montiporae TaxID=1027273 RepID=A0A081N7Q3_9GAMM|nr:hypothetical protein [Endozoicomonas montiporae]AMO55668.1 hypothetical protein EZMO1_1500 [Endozoicomonas montiporae CL-33]KEQ14476.1 hypothetical protein GZ77_08940 [Endozoicomonas montiporae]